MTYKRYIVINGKRYGPYEYKSFRDKNGVHSVRFKEKKLNLFSEEKEKRIFQIAGLLFLILAIVISLTGTVFFLTKTGQFGHLSGYVDYGHVNLSITETTTVNITAYAINFGSGYVHGNATMATLISDGYAANWSGVGTSTTLELRNDGNVNITVSFTATKNATNFTGGTNPGYYFNTSNKDASACNTGLASVFQDVNSSAQQATICTNLGTDDAIDELYMYVKLDIPSDATGTKADSWTFTSAKCSGC